jgi:hypothetical protein
MSIAVAFVVVNFGCLLCIVCVYSKDDIMPLLL